jgi:hypothetical protein
MAADCQETLIAVAIEHRPEPWTVPRTEAAPVVETAWEIAAFPNHLEAAAAAHSVEAVPAQQGPAVRVDRPALGEVAVVVVEAVDAVAVGGADSCLRIGADT